MLLVQYTKYSHSEAFGVFNETMISLDVPIACYNNQWNYSDKKQTNVNNKQSMISEHQNYITTQCRDH